MRVIFEDVELVDIDDNLTVEQVRSTLSALYPSIANATATVEEDDDGEKVMTFTRKVAQKG